MTAIEFHILNSYDPVFYHHRSEIAVSDVIEEAWFNFCTCWCFSFESGFDSNILGLWKKRKSVSVKVKMSISSLKQTSLGIGYHLCTMSLQKIIAEEMNTNRFKIVFQQAMEHLILQLGKNLNSNTTDITVQSLIERGTRCESNSPKVARLGIRKNMLSGTPVVEWKKIQEFLDINVQRACCVTSVLTNQTLNIKSPPLFESL